MTPSKLQATFYAVLTDAEANVNEFTRNPGSDMTRHRKCSFKDTVVSTLCLSSDRTSTELLNYFMDKNSPIPSKSAYTQQRNKLNDKLFPYILKSFNAKVPLKKTFKGFHLIAADGSDINLPTDKKDRVYCVKQARSDNYYYQMHLNALFDLCENRYVAGIVQPRPRMNEKKAFCEMIDTYDMPGNTIFIADRGYDSMNTLAHLLKKCCFFVIRSKTPAYGSLLRYILQENVVADRMVTLGVTRSRKKKYKKCPDQYKCIRPDRAFDPIPVGDTTTVYYMTLRCTCIQLDNGTYEYLISNLPVEKFSSNDLKTLYWKRWGIETSFRTLKYALSLVYLHSVKRELIIQEIFAKMIMYNFASLLHAYAERRLKNKSKTPETKYEYTVAFENIIAIARKLLIRKRLNSIIKALLLSYLTPKKVNQTIASTRIVHSQRVKPLNNRA